MTPQRLRLRIRELPAHPPITTAFGSALDKRGPWSGGQYSSQKQHWLGWLSAYDGPGYYGRKNWNRSAEFAYNHIVCPPMVLWLGEAAGIPKSIVEKAKRSALRAGPHFPAQCGAIRKIISWQMIEVLLGKKRST